MSKIGFEYAIDGEELLIVGDVAMAQWTLSTTGLTACGLGPEVRVEGMLTARFCHAPASSAAAGGARGAAAAAAAAPANEGRSRLRAVELTYDVASFMRQLASKSLLDLSVVSLSAPPPPPPPPAAAASVKREDGAAPAAAPPVPAHLLAAAAGAAPSSRFTLLSLIHISEPTRPY